MSTRWILLGALVLAPAVVHAYGGSYNATELKRKQALQKNGKPARTYSFKSGAGAGVVGHWATPVAAAGTSADFQSFAAGSPIAHNEGVALWATGLGQGGKTLAPAMAGAATNSGGGTGTAGNGVFTNGPVLGLDANGNTITKSGGASSNAPTTSPIVGH